MRYPFLSFIVVVSVSMITQVGCKNNPIGQPCQFSWWPKTAGEGVQCDALPKCHPLKNSLSQDNDACPLDCFEMPTMQCDNLICITTQVASDSQRMNGQCTQNDNSPDSECPGSNAPFGCIGYCTKECLSDASCPDGYYCSALAPFGTLPCDDDKQWPDACTDNCVHSGHLVDAKDTTCDPAKDDKCCPSESESDKCSQTTYDKCCYCICSKFCPLNTKKICRKVKYDEKMFPKGTLSDTALNNLNMCDQKSSQ